jgi:hypothetical protein
MHWKFASAACFALILLPLLVRAQDTPVSISTWEYTFPDGGDACVQFDWQGMGFQDRTLQIVMRAIDTNGDFLLNGVGTDTGFADRAGLLTSRLDVVMPFEHTEWTDTLICLPANQFPAGEYDWYPVVTILDRTGGGILLMTSMSESIHFGQLEGGLGQLIPAPQSTPEVSP